jgi:hypothetical protein
MDTERRLGQRWPLDCPAKISLKYNNKVKNFECQLKNLSLKGLQAFLKKKLPGPEVLKVKLFLPEDTTLELRVKVISFKAVDGGGYLYNLAIIGAKEEGRELIYQFVHRKFYPDMVKKWWDTQEKDV